MADEEEEDEEDDEEEESEEEEEEEETEKKAPQRYFSKSEQQCFVHGNTPCVKPVDILKSFMIPVLMMLERVVES